MARSTDGIGERLTATCRWRCRGALAVALMALAGCSVAPRASDAASRRAPVPVAASGMPADRDGAVATPPPDLAAVADAEPRIETIRSGGPNKPYEMLGQSYVPQVRDAPFRQRGMASWYGSRFHGRRTASGEVYNMYAMTGAHPTLPLPSYVRVRNPANGAEAVLRINDRGPFHGGRVIDLSYAAAVKLGVHGGVAPVELERITFDDIRTGAWRRPANPGAALAQAAGAPGRREAAPEPLPVPGPVLTAADAVALAAAPRVAPAEATATATPSAPPADVPASAAAETAAAPAATPSAVAAVVPAGFWVQLGAFQQRAGAEGFHRRVAADVDWLAPLLAVFSEPALHRLQAGPYASRDEAQSVAQRVRDALKLVPVVLERR